MLRIVVSKIVTHAMDDAHLSISEMEPYFAYYPDKLYKNLVETRVIYKDMEEEILLEIKKRDGL